MSVAIPASKQRPEIIPVILSGGAGARLWPVSNALNPKPFIRMADGTSLIQYTFLRAAGIAGVEKIVVVTNRDHFYKTACAFEELGLNGISCTYILEPEGRDTAAAVAIAALHVHNTHGAGAVMLLLPADHLIRDIEMYNQAVNQAISMAGEGQLVTFGIKPTYAETGYGYIESNGSQVIRFVEKPDLETAESYCASGRHLWNSGMFCVTCLTLLELMQKHAYDILSSCEQTLAASPQSLVPNGVQIMLDHASFSHVPKVSFDVAVVEKAVNIGVIACDMGWSDIGSWSAIAELTAPDMNGNRIDGQALMIETENCYVRSNGRTIGMVGVKDLIVVDSGDAILIAHVGQAQLVKQINLAGRSIPDVARTLN